MSMIDVEKKLTREIIKRLKGLFMAFEWTPSDLHQLVEDALEELGEND